MLWLVLLPTVGLKCAGLQLSRNRNGRKVNDGCCSGTDAAYGVLMQPGGDFVILGCHNIPGPHGVEPVSARRPDDAIRSTRRYTRSAVWPTYRHYGHKEFDYSHHNNMLVKAPELCLLRMVFSERSC